MEDHAIEITAALLIAFVAAIFIDANKPARDAQDNVCKEGAFYDHPEVGKVQISDTIYKVDSGNQVVATSVETGGRFTLDCKSMTPARIETKVRYDK